MTTTMARTTATTKPTGDDAMKPLRDAARKEFHSGVHVPPGIRGYLRVLFGEPPASQPSALGKLMSGSSNATAMQFREEKQKRNALRERFKL